MIETCDIIKSVPNMKSGNELISALSAFPEYDGSIRSESQSFRLTALSDLYKIYVPSRMSTEIYSRLYLSLLRSLQKKGTKTAIRQQYQNHRAIKGQEYNGIIGGSDSFTVIGTSGIGKSSAISRAVTLITENRIIESENPYAKIIPCLSVQCPFDSSVKGLLFEILRKVDEILESGYYKNALRARATTDMLIGSVSQAALNHIGLLIVDEIQNVVNSKNGKILIGALTQLINNSGISVCMVGTPESAGFFESAMHLARRSVGLRYSAMSYDEYFESFCKIVFEYQYLKRKTEITPAIIQWLYEHSGGVASVVISLIHDAQEIAILTGSEILNSETLNAAYNQRLSLLHGYIEPAINKGKSASNTRARKNNVPQETTEIQTYSVGISELAVKSKTEGIDIVELLKSHFPVAEVRV